jgi:hypothetical protein
MLSRDELDLLLKDRSLDSLRLRRVAAKEANGQKADANAAPPSAPAPA